MNNVLHRIDYRSLNDAKANFDQIYVQADPREYYRVLYGLDYVIPDLAKGVFRNAIDALERKLGRRVKVLDLGCSYGNNAALLRHPLDIDRLAQRYRELEGAELSSRELMALDRNYFLSWPRRDVEIVGLDVSEPAIAYAKSVGLLDDGLAVDLETAAVTPELRQLLEGVDLIISTGCVGYVTARTFAAIFEAVGAPTPWVASFVLRMFPFADIEATCARNDLVTEKFEGVTFVQRRFHSQEECEQVLTRLETAGLDTAGKEADGLYHAEFFLSRHRRDIEETSLEEIASVTSGAGRQFGPRYVRIGEDILRFRR